LISFTTDELKRYAVARQRFFERPALCIGAEEHGEIGGRSAAEHRFDLRDDKAGFGFFCVGCEIGDLLAGAAVGPEFLRVSTGEALYDAVSGVEDNLGASVVLLELDDCRAGEVALEAQDILDVGAAPAVDALIVVADGANIVVRGRQQPDEAILGIVCVLVFVDEDVFEALALPLEDFIACFEQLDGAQ